MARNSEPPKELSIDGHTVAVTHPSKLLWPDDGISKLDLVHYYLKVAPVILPHIRGRPLTLKPYTSGIRGPAYYTHSVPENAPPWIETFTWVPKTRPGKTIHPVVANDAATLAWLATNNVIEIHTWLSCVEHPEKPDLLVFDLDPGDEVEFPRVLETALSLKEELTARGLEGWPKTSGGSGVHVYVPIEAGYPFEHTRRLAEEIAVAMADRDPGHITATLADPDLKRKVHVDYAQNSLGRTMAAPYSVRPRTKAPVSAPLTWREVEGGRVAPSDFTLATMPRRIEQYGDLYAPVARRRQHLPT